MNVQGISLEMAYLYVGDDVDRIKTARLYVKYFKGIKYYEVDEHMLIKSERQIHCSCNEKYCWHILKLVIDEGKAISKSYSLENKWL